MAAPMAPSWRLTQAGALGNPAMSQGWPTIADPRYWAMSGDDEGRVNQWQMLTLRLVLARCHRLTILR